MSGMLPEQVDAEIGCGLAPAGTSETGLCRDWPAPKRAKTLVRQGERDAGFRPNGGDETKSANEEAAANWFLSAAVEDERERPAIFYRRNDGGV